jgi:hypothetical protein
MRDGMSCRALRLDLSLLAQAVELERESGFASLEELARLGAFLEHAFYVPKSLRASGQGVEFEIHNPPLRMGAFRAAQVHWDGRAVPADRAVLAVEGAEPLRFADIRPERPLSIPSGRVSTVRLGIDQRPSYLHHHLVRLELRSVAIPPLVWLEFSDRLRRGRLARPR